MTPRGLPLFVYGTLLSDGDRAGLLAGMKRAKAKVRGRLYRMPAGYPALVHGGEEWVEGELVDLTDPRRLTVLDRYEGVDEGLYQRIQLPVVLGLRALTGWTYVMTDPERRGGRLIPHGRWRPLRIR